MDGTVSDAAEATWFSAVPACLAALKTAYGSQYQLWQLFNSSGTLGDTAITPGSQSTTALAHIGATTFFNP